ncbi:MAG: trimethylamine methyltransferase, partial [Alphaproteobacteria bacterium]|nr:trimethylamine methyltransferase [Alphaproteobacteria bacterium]
MADTAIDTSRAEGGRRGRGGSAARRAQREHPRAHQLPYISRNIPVMDLASLEALEIIERNAETILEEIGIEFRDDEEALQAWRAAGADVRGERVHFPRGLCRQIIQRSAPRSFVQHARNPARNVKIGG